MASIGRAGARKNSRQIWWFALILIAATAIAYLPAWNGKPIWDDRAHITQPELRSTHGLVEIWTHLGATQQYYPLVHTVFWIEQKLWGDSVVGYHLVNILLHGLSAIVLLRILLRLNIPGAWLAAGLFALHPVQVESVAWISELKNTLSGLFFFLSIFSYLNFDETRSRRSYFASLGFFVCGLMCKTVIAPLPAIILVILWWKRGALRKREDIVPVLPLFVVGIAAGLFTAWVERHFVGAQGSAFQLSILQRCLIAARDFWFYLFKLFWPAKLTFIYPRWEISAAAVWPYLFMIALIAVLAFAWATRTRSRGPLATALIFLGLLFPALGFVNVYPFLYSFVADHFQYLACVAPLTLFASAVAIAIDRWAPNKTFLRAPIYSALLLVAGLLSWAQSRDYKNIETLWRATITRNPDCWMAYSNLGSFLLERGEVNEAVADFRKALEIRPEQSKDHNNLGKALIQKGRIAEAKEHFETALRISPNDPDAQSNIGAALLQEGNADKAIEQLRQAVEKFPEHAQAHINLGNGLLQAGQTDAAIAEFEKTFELQFDHAESHYSLATAFRQKGDIEGAIVHYRKAIELRTDFANAHNNLGNAFRQQRRFTEAAREYQAALKSDAQSVLAANNFAWLLATCPDASVRNGARAVELAEQAAHSSGGNNPIILHTLAAAYAEDGQFDKAVAAAKEALETAEANGISGLTESLRNKLLLYQAGSPYHESATSP
jgi:tetratricopeptide (TPR) repeat protein